MMSINDKNYSIQFVRNESLDLSKGVQFVSSSKCGAISTFSGTIRDTDLKLGNNELEPIEAIWYEAYESMASKQIEGIIRELVFSPPDDKWPRPSAETDPNCRVYVALRLGLVPPQEAAVIICVSSTGRTISHWATLAILEQIKSSVAIWKKIHFTDGRQEWAGECKSEASWLRKAR